MLDFMGRGRRLRRVRQDGRTRLFRIFLQEILVVVAGRDRQLLPYLPCQSALGLQTDKLIMPGSFLPSASTRCGPMAGRLKIHDLRTR
ncbi:MAG: hypothetical protein TE42_07140 [Candidatus Synechococcus spongiarum SP3]|uniref:Uncharacterized protein n=1 Tax=Candidatus Synechococcus spongiarum SP3 TaxID=1604020 RepID=A0A0G2HLA6_9SYNE|nr:MAG: hypothetical protein TE42_07140 [Candidatus Synechococcus spongiarum SP3]